MSQLSTDLLPFLKFGTKFNSNIAWASLMLVKRIPNTIFSNWGGGPRNLDLEAPKVYFLRKPTLFLCKMVVEVLKKIVGPFGVL